MFLDLADSWQDKNWADKWRVCIYSIFQPSLATWCDQNDLVFSLVFSHFSWVLYSLLNISLLLVQFTICAGLFENWIFQCCSPVQLHMFINYTEFPTPTNKHKVDQAYLVGYQWMVWKVALEYFRQLLSFRHLHAHTIFAAWLFERQTSREHV